jgi:hypothetical protein
MPSIIHHAPLELPEEQARFNAPHAPLENGPTLQDNPNVVRAPRAPLETISAVLRALRGPFRPMRPPVCAPYAALGPTQAVTPLFAKIAQPIRCGLKALPASRVLKILFRIQEAHLVGRVQLGPSLERMVAVCAHQALLCSAILMR